MPPGTSTGTFVSVSTSLTVLPPCSASLVTSSSPSVSCFLPTPKARLSCSGDTCARLAAFSGGTPLLTSRRAKPIPLCGLRALVPLTGGPRLVEGDQGLHRALEALGLASVVLAPCEAVLLLSAGVIAADARLPECFLLIGIHLPLPSSALDHGVELLLDHLRVLYGVH